MAEVVDLTDARSRKSRGGDAVALEDVAPAHPALRWIAGEMWWAAHRRNPQTRAAACGAEGELVLASPGVPLCLACYPPRG